MKSLEVGRYYLLLKEEIDDSYQDTLDGLISAFALDNDWLLGVNIDESIGSVYIAAKNLINGASWTLVFRLNRFNTVLKVEFVCYSYKNVKSDDVGRVMNEINKFFLAYVNDTIKWRK